jgi:hypothetical protein
MAQQFFQIPLRLQLSTASAPQIPPIDANTGEQPAFWRAQDVQIQFAVFDAQNNPIDFSNLKLLQLIIADYPNAPAPSIVAQLSPGQFQDITWEQWQNGTSQNGTFILPASSTDLGLRGKSERQFWLSVQGLTINGGILVYGGGYILIRNPGASIPAAIPTYVSLNEQTVDEGSAVVVPSSQLHTEQVTFTGEAGTYPIALTFAGLGAGARLDLGLIFPSPPVAGLIILVFNGSLQGTQLAQFTTDAFTANGLLQFVFDGIAWNLERSIFPAY